jgi:hypothetical protein
VEITVATLCDSAADYNGKLCMLGSFDTIFAAQYPCHHAQCSVAVRLLLRDEDVGPHAIRVVFIGPDGHPLIPLENLPAINFQVSPMPANVFFASHNVVINFQGLPAPAPGQCEIRISVDNQVVRTLPFQFVQLRQPA